jgi:hypothetical protein
LPGQATKPSGDRATDDGGERPIPGSDSQGNSDFRKITRNLSLTFAAFGDTGQGHSFLILVGCLALSIHGS